MLKKLYWLMALVLLLSLPALACGPFGGNDAEATAVPAASDSGEQTEPAAEANAPAAEEPTAEETAPEPAAEEATAVPAASDSDEPAAEESAPALSAADLTLPTGSDLPFNSYRVTMEMSFTGVNADGEEVTQAMTMNSAYTTDPAATSVTMNMTGLDNAMGGDLVEMAQIEGTTYMVIPDVGCITTQDDSMSDAPFADIMSPDDFLGDLDGAKYEGEETINGVRTLHYSFDKAVFLSTQMSGDEIEEAEGHIYIAKDGNYVVRMVIDATGKIDLLDKGGDENGDLHIEMNLLDIDEPIEIVMPAACEAGAAGGSAFPVMDDATETATFGGMTSYKTAAATEDVLAFYDDALVADGWVKDESSSFISGGTALVSYTRDGETLTLSINADENAGGTDVLLMSDAGE